MNNTITNVKYGYTKQGNQYKKSTNGKKIGVAAGALYSGACLLSPGLLLENGTKTNYINYLKDQLMNLYTNNYATKSQVYGIIAGVCAVTTLMFTLAGGLIGKSADLLANKIRSTQADKQNSKVLEIQA